MALVEAGARKVHRTAKDVTTGREPLGPYRALKARRLQHSANANGGGTTPPHRALNEGRPMGRPADADLPGRPPSQDEVARVELDGLRHMDLHLGVGIGVG